MLNDKLRMICWVLRTEDEGVCCAGDRELTFELKFVKTFEGSFHVVLIKLHVESVAFRSNIVPVSSVTGRDNVHWMKVGQARGGRSRDRGVQVQENENNITVVATDRYPTVSLLLATSLTAGADAPRSMTWGPAKFSGTGSASQLWLPAAS